MTKAVACDQQRWFAQMKLTCADKRPELQLVIRSGDEHQGHGRQGGHVYDRVGDLHISACQVQRKT